MEETKNESEIEDPSEIFKLINTQKFVIQNNFIP